MMLNKSKSELKPCPFCGSTHIEIEKTQMCEYEKANIESDGYWYDCFCNNCLAGTSDFITQEDAEKAWNTRAKDKSNG